MTGFCYSHCNKALPVVGKYRFTVDKATFISPKKTHLPEVYSAEHVEKEEDGSDKEGETGCQPPPKKPPSSAREIASHIDPHRLHLMDTEGGIAGGNRVVAMRITSH